MVSDGPFAPILIPDPIVIPPSIMIPDKLMIYFLLFIYLCAITDFYGYVNGLAALCVTELLLVTVCVPDESVVTTVPNIRYWVLAPAQLVSGKRASANTL